MLIVSKYLKDTLKQMKKKKCFPLLQKARHEAMGLRLQSRFGNLERNSLAARMVG